MQEERPAGIVISPMGIGEVLDTGFSLARRHYRLLVTITAWGAVPSYGLLALGGVFMAPMSRGEPPTGVGVLGLAISIAAYGVGTMITAAALIVACGFLIAPTGDPAERSAAYLYGEVAGRLVTMVVLGVLVTIASIPLVIVFPLGVYVWVRWSVAWVAILFEHAGPVEALKRSWALTSGSWWHTAVVMFTSSLIVGILSSIVGGLFGGAGAVIELITGDHVLGAVLNAAGQGVGFVLIEAFAASILAVLYFELRARIEGFDLAQRGLQITQ